jgi:hypothetical protein
MAKKATTFAERQEAAKKKFDEQMKKRYESFEHKVKQKSKKPLTSIPSDTSSSNTDSSSMGSPTESSTGTNSTGQNP